MRNCLQINMVQSCNAIEPRNFVYQRADVLTGAKGDII